MMDQKLLLIIIDGVPWHNFRTLFGNLEGWVETGKARLVRHRSCLPSISGPCYASIHTGLEPQIHGILSNEQRFRINQPDIFSQVTKAGGKTAAVTHSYWSEFFNRHPFDHVCDIEYDEPDGPIHHGRFHTMTGYNHDNQMTPCDADLFASLTNLCQRFDVNYGIYHSCTLDSMGHRFGHENSTMDSACFAMDSMLAAFLPKWRDMGYEVIVTADHGQSIRGHHGGAEDIQRDTALYWFGDCDLGKQYSGDDALVDQRQLAPTILKRLGVPVPPTMKHPSFLE